MPKTKDAIEILDRLTVSDEELRDLIEKETINVKVAAGFDPHGIAQGSLSFLVTLELDERLAEAMTKSRSLGESTNRPAECSFRLWKVLLVEKNQRSGRCRDQAAVPAG